MWEGGFVIKAKETKLYLNGELVDCFVVDFNIKQDESIPSHDRLEFTTTFGFETLANSCSDIFERLIKLDNPKKQSWQGEGKRRKPRIK